jgi:hypothetical protein
LAKAKLSDKQKKINKLIANMAKAPGLKDAIQVTSLDDIRTPFHIKRPTGIMSLDIHLNGGFPGGCLIQLHGRDGVGKNALLYMTCAENQRIYGPDSAICLVSLGYKPDVTQMRLCGMQVPFTHQEMEEMGWSKSDPGYEVARGGGAGEVRILELQNSDAAKEAPSENLLYALANIIQSGLFQIVAIDELGSGETKDDKTKTFVEAKKVASWAGLWTRFQSRYYTVMREPLEDGEANATNLFVLNPARANISTSNRKSNAPPPDNMTSGHALKHAKAVDIRLNKKAKIRTGGEHTGQEVGWTILKGKNGISQGASGTYVYNFIDGVDKVADLETVAKAMDVIYYRNPKWRVPTGEFETEDGEEYEKEAQMKKEEITDFLRHNLSARERVKQLTLEALSDMEDEPEE